jgi:hypothetical protein
MSDETSADLGYDIYVYDTVCVFYYVGMSVCYIVYVSHGICVWYVSGIYISKKRLLICVRHLCICVCVILCLYGMTSICGMCMVCIYMYIYFFWGPFSWVWVGGVFSPLRGFR